MVRKYTLMKRIAAVLIERVYENNLPIAIHKGNEHQDPQGNRLVDVLLEYNDAVVVNDLISEIVDDFYI